MNSFSINLILSYKPWFTRTTTFLYEFVNQSSYKLEFQDGLMFTVLFEEIKKYMPETKDRPEGVPIVNQLLVSRISKIESEINFWINYDFEYKDL